MMMAIAAILSLATADTAASAQRSAFSKCLKESIEKAKSAKVAAEAFDAFARAHCAAPEAALRKTVVAFDMKNGISRKDANENATFELDDYFLGTTERYVAAVGPTEPEKAEAKTEQAAAQTPQP